MIPIKNINKKSLYDSKVSLENKIELPRRTKGMKASLL